MDTYMDKFVDMRMQGYADSARYKTKPTHRSPKLYLFITLQLSYPHLYYHYYKISSANRSFLIVQGVLSSI